MIRSMLARFLKGEKAMDETKLREGVEELRSIISRDIKGGYAGHGEIVDDALEMISDEYDIEPLRPHAQRVFDEELALHRAAEREWPAVTDYDRLDRAFANLEARGIVCRQNFTCCGTCGSAEIWDQIKEATDMGVAVRGYAFFHMQDTEGAVDGSGLYLNYGAVEEGEQAALDVAREISGEIESSSLKVDWDGSWQKRIGVKLDWKRRLPA